MTGIRIKRNVRDDSKVGELRLDRTNGPRGKAIVIKCFLSVGCSQAIVYDRKQCDCRNTKLNTALGFHEQPVNGQALYPWHRRYGFAAILAINDENGIDQII